ncbi:porin [Psychromonas marina]|uniref:Porin n=1 Tax=Psychromonas marina TaxID=88364 RepID=A0ABQ6E1X5_9GAMM|nr:porin [Psychromonas marina]GLS91352.1 porin [Psychromonas marina]
MKKTLLAIAIPAALLATSAQAVELYKTDVASVDFYGQMRTEVKVLTDKDVTLGAGSSRSGVKASYAVNDSVNVFGTFEFGLSGNGGSLESRLHYAGVEGDFGKLSFGKQWTVSDDIYGAEYSYFFGGSALFYSILSGAEHDSLIKYNFETDDFWIAANVGLAEDDSSQELYEAFIGTSVGDLNLHAGYGLNKDKVEDSETKDWKNEYFQVTAEYSVGDGVIGFTYYNAELSSLNNDSKVKENGYSLGGMYSVSDAIGLYAGLELTDHDVDALDDSTNFFIGADYQINDWSKVYAEYAYSDGQTLGFSNKASGNEVELASSADKDSNFAVGYRVYW